MYFNGQITEYYKQFYQPYEFYLAPIFAIPGWQRYFTAGKNNRHNARAVASHSTKSTAGIHRAGRFKMR